MSRSNLAILGLAPLAGNSLHFFDLPLNDYDLLGVKEFYEVGRAVRRPGYKHHQDRQET
jgi:hypothetical protein